MNAPTNGAGCSVSGTQFVLFGGLLGNGNACSNAVYIYDTNTKNWTLQIPTGGQAPSPRSGASVVTFQDSIVVYGGTCNGVYYSDIWSYSLTGKTWSNETVAGRAQLPALAYHAAGLATNSTFYVFGGASMTSTATSNLYSYNILSKNWTQIILNGPSARQQSSLTVSGNRLFIFGGTDLTNYYNDVWQLVLEKDCKSLKCDDCTKASFCGWCTSRTLCVAGNESTVFISSSCVDPEYTRKLTLCPEEGFPSWAIALIVIGGVVLIGIIVFAIMKVRSKSDYSAI